MANPNFSHSQVVGTVQKGVEVSPNDSDAGASLNEGMEANLYFFTFYFNTVLTYFVERTKQVKG